MEWHDNLVIGILLLIYSDVINIKGKGHDSAEGILFFLGLALIITAVFRVVI